MIFFTPAVGKTHIQNRHSPMKCVVINRFSRYAGPPIYIWLRGQAVKTSPFHGGNTGSIPVGVTFGPFYGLNQRTFSSVG